MEQRTDEWFEKRKECVTSTDAAIINGTNTFDNNSPYRLWQKKLGFIKDNKKTNPLIAQGIVLEKKAREVYQKQTDNLSEPTVQFHKEHPWLMASTDGVSLDGKILLEIKCGPSSFQKAQIGLVPDYYYDQIQHSLHVCDCETCHYFCFYEKESVLIEVKRNEEHIKMLFEKEKEFYDFLVKMVPPPISSDEFLTIDDDEATSDANLWFSAKVKLTEASINEKKAREILLEHTDGGNCIFPNANLKVKLVKGKKIIDWKSVSKKFEITEDDLKPFEKEGASYQRILINNNGGAK